MRPLARAFLFITLVASSGKRNVTAWRPSIRLSVPSFFTNFHSARGDYST